MLEIRTADELADPALEARWARRRASPQGAMLRRVLRAFAERGGPVPVEALLAGVPEAGAAAALAALDAEDLVQLRDGAVVIAYPFSAAPTPFVVRLPDGGERYACCAIDALGMAPMLGRRLRVAAPCHHCDEPLAFTVGPEGPGEELPGAMVWVGRRLDDQRRVSASL